MRFESTHGIGDIIYLKTDPDQLERIITQVSFKGGGSVVYSVSMGASEIFHYDMEISNKRDLLKQLDISNSQTV